MTGPTCPLWVMTVEKVMGYWLWKRRSILAGNQLGGPEKVWVIRGYGLSQVWVKAEATVAWHVNTNLAMACHYMFPAKCGLHTCIGH